MAASRTVSEKGNLGKRNFDRLAQSNFSPSPSTTTPHVNVCLDSSWETEQPIFPNLPFQMNMRQQSRSSMTVSTTTSQYIPDPSPAPVYKPTKITKKEVQCACDEEHRERSMAPEPQINPSQSKMIHHVEAMKDGTFTVWPSSIVCSWTNSSST